MELILGWIRVVKIIDPQGFFCRSEFQGGGGGLEQKGDMRDLRLELVLVYDLYEKRSLMMKLDQVSY